MSNPLSGKSVPDGPGHHVTITDYFAEDGTFIKTVENESRNNPLLRAAFHFVIDAEGNIQDSGRDWLTIATSPIDIGPLCAALS